VSYNCMNDSPNARGRSVKIEAVTTCVNYADILAHTLPMNYHQFDKFVVVTAPEDKKTAQVCTHYTGVQCVKTDVFKSRWEGEFHKGSGINEGLKVLDKDAWILHLDSDIVLPPNFRKVLETADLDTTMIYGADRAEFKNYEAWHKFYGEPEPHTQGVMVHVTHHGQRIGTRVSFASQGGYTPIGFFQLWHADSGILKYPQGHSTAAREDTLFPWQWPRKKRALIPEIVVYHLESENAEMAVNWRGRTTKPFSITSL
jgi:hypothetical protein